jgi:ketosteroid isomerase-like protein
MSTEQNKEIVRRAVSAMGRGDWEGLLADAADDFTLTVMMTPAEPNIVRGKEKVLKMLRKVLGTQLEGGAIAMTIDNLLAEGEYVVEQAHGKARTKGGKDYNNTYCRVWRIVNGKLVSFQEYLDTELARACLFGEK